MLLSLSIALGAVIVMTDNNPAPSVPAPASQHSVHAAKAEQERIEAARGWLALVDNDDWEGSYAVAGRAFQRPNTVASWQAAAEQVHATYGAVTARTFIGSEMIASPEGYKVVRFRTDFEKMPGIVEHVTLVREEGELRVVGYFLS